MSNWTQGNVGDFVYSISLDFFTQLEDRIQESKLQQKELAERLEITPSAVSQMLSSPPGKPELETLVKYALAVGSKVSVVLYDDDDPNNERGPVYSGIFEKSWETLNKPRDLEEVSALFEAKNGVTGFTLEPIPETFTLGPSMPLHVYEHQPVQYWGFSGSPFHDKGVQGYLLSTDGPIYHTSGSWQRGTAVTGLPEWNRQKTAILPSKEKAA